MSFFETSDRCRIHYEISGQGEPIILIHGWTCNTNFFQYQTPVFAKDYQVITYDLRGHGISDKSAAVTEVNMSLDTFARDLHELIDHLALRKVNLAGWSMGTSVILNYIDLYGEENLNSICCIDMTPKMLADSQWQLGLSRTFNAENNLNFMALVATDWEAAAESFVPRLFARGYDRDSDLYQWTMGQVKNNVPHCMLNMWLAMFVKDYRPVLPKITVPAFLAYGADGPMFGADHGRYMHDHIRNSTLEIYHGCGHGLMFEDPEKFNRDYLDFLRNIDDSGI